MYHDFFPSFSSKVNGIVGQFCTKESNPFEQNEEESTSKKERKRRASALHTLLCYGCFWWGIDCRWNKLFNKVLSLHGAEKSRPVSVFYTSGMDLPPHSSTSSPSSVTPVTTSPSSAVSSSVFYMNVSPTRTSDASPTSTSWGEGHVTQSDTCMCVYITCVYVWQVYISGNPGNPCQSCNPCNWCNPVTPVTHVTL